MLMRRGMLGISGGGLPTGIKAFTTGTATLQADSTDFWVTTGLGYIPDYAALWIEDQDATLIPNGACVKVVYMREAYENSNITSPRLQYYFLYKHATSGNILDNKGSGSLSQQATETTFNFKRGTVDWRALDTNGSPIVYRWFALKLDDNA